MRYSFAVSTECSGGSLEAQVVSKEDIQMADETEGGSVCLDPTV